MTPLSGRNMAKPADLGIHSYFLAGLQKLDYVVSRDDCHAVTTRSFIMLMLGRKNGQKVLLKTSDGLIEVMFKEFVNGNAYIGFEAPKTVNIVREELLRENAPAIRCKKVLKRAVHK